LREFFHVDPQVYAITKIICYNTHIPPLLLAAGSKKQGHALLFAYSLHPLSDSSFSNQFQSETSPRFYPHLVVLTKILRPGIMKV